VRGEYVCPPARAAEPMELPPRARRIHALNRFGAVFLGTTSACAENTIFLTLANIKVGNYLRVRGEYHNKYQSCPCRVELPPRARRIPTPAPFDRAPSGTTSACAENTAVDRKAPGERWNYLRVRGEYRKQSRNTATNQELPPRARRIRK